MKILYLFSGTHEIPNYDIEYVDLLNGKDVNNYWDKLNEYDLILASPPCNYWSRANYRRETSKYAQVTKHLLPLTIQKLKESGKPFIVENVINEPLIKPLQYGVNYFKNNRHGFWTNTNFVFKGEVQKQGKIQNISNRKRQGLGMREIFEQFIKENII